MAYRRRGSIIWGRVFILTLRPRMQLVDRRKKPARPGYLNKLNQPLDLPAKPGLILHLLFAREDQARSLI